MRIDRKRFWAEYRTAFYPKGGLSQRTVSALEYILARVEEAGLAFFGTVEALAYCLATWKHESGHTAKEGAKIVRVEYEPVRERRASPTRQAKLYRSQERYFKTGHQGRGIIQTTWADNYYKIGETPGIKGLQVAYKGEIHTVSGAFLRDNPDALLDARLSYLAAALGMQRGLYRPPHKLSTYFKKGKPPDYVNARNIVNGGLDKAELIASYARAFERILRASMVSEEPQEPLAEELDPNLPESIKDAEEEAERIRQEEEEAAAAQPAPAPPPTPEEIKRADEAIPPEEPVLTKLKGKYAAVIGTVVSIATSVGGFLGGLPPMVLAALIFAMGITTAALVVGVIYIKDKRESRAHELKLAMIGK